jgi:Na+/melibiose symporter-like transporter
LSQIISSDMLEGMDKTSGAEPPFHPLDYLKITILGFAFGALANAMHAIILPLLIQDFAGYNQKSTYLGLITFAGLIVAIMVQPIIGAISDRSKFSWGRRKPFILIGITVTLGLMIGIGSGGGFAALFIMWCLMQASLNTAQGPFQALIPDLIPHNRRGLASGIKSLLEILGGVVLLRLIGNLMVNYSPGTGSFQVWISLGALGAILLITTLITLLFVREKTIQGSSSLPWSSVLYSSFRFDVKANPGFILFLISRLLFLMALTTLQTFALYYFQDVVKIANPSQITADLIIAVGVAMLIVVYPAGRFSDKLGRRPILVCCGFLAAAGVALIFFFHNYTLIMFGGSLIGIAAGAFMSTNWALATDLVPQNEVARYVGLTNLATAGGAALARLIGPPIDWINGYRAGLGYSFLLGTCFIYFIASSILIWRIRK